MLDIQFIRDNAERVADNAARKGYKADVPALLAIDEQRRTVIAEVDVLRQKRNELSRNQKGQKPAPEVIKEGAAIKQQLAEVEKTLASLDDEYSALLKKVPNMALEDVPAGSTEDENVVVRTVGAKPDFDFKPKNHGELAESRGWLDKERAAKVAGARFAYIKGDLARLEFALWQYGIDTLTDEKVLKKIADDNGLKVDTRPFTFVLPPAVARTEVFEATGRLNREEMTYKLEDDDLWLNASAEHTLAPMYLNETLDKAELPIRLIGYTTAFRREAGSYGRDTEGIFRLHQFNKLEMESFTTAQTSYDEHLFQIAIQEYLMQQLGLPYQVLEKCTGDIGFPNAKGVDINVWLPAQQQYRETHTADHITDFQARSMRTRVRDEAGDIGFVHTNDATVFSERPLAAILENFQRADGSVAIPEVLQPYMGNRKELR